MKHILPILTAALALTATSAFAAFNYTVETTKYTNQNNQGTDWEYYTIHITEGTGRIYLMDYINNLQDRNEYHDGHWGQNESIEAQGIIKYGWYDASKMKETDTLSVDDVHWTDVSKDNRAEGPSFNDPYNTQNTIPITRYKYDLGTDFKEGSVIGIAMMAKDGSIVGSFSKNENRNSTRYGTTWNHSVDQYAAYQKGWTIEAREFMPVAELTFGTTLGNNSTQMRYLFAGEATTVIPPTEPEPLGTPLPGGLQIALIAGLFGLGFWYVRRRKTVAA